MTDFDFDVKEKKSVARSAKHKVSGAKSRKCTLATDYMTPSQIKKMNGETISYNTNKPMTLKEFKKVPPAAGKEYILQLVNLYGVNYTTLSQMFGCGRAACARLLSDSPYEIKFGRGSSMTKAQREQWKVFLNGPQEETDEQSEGKEQKSMENLTREDLFKDAEPLNLKPAPTPMKMDRFTLEFSGNLSVDAIANSLRLILGDGREGRITIQASFRGSSYEF